jgi:UDPglucose--hexose-1-phosphate uridylyltransferase
MLQFDQVPHRRFNPLTREWVLVSPHRNQRPWQGEVTERSTTARPQYDPACYLCPSNARAGGVQNPQYSGTFVFDNDYAALQPQIPEESIDVETLGLIRAESERGVCRVVCFSPRHDLTLATMSIPGVQRVVDLWTAQYQELGAREYINHVQIFENRGAMMGASNPHPHCQIWATAHLPNQPAKEQAAQLEYRAGGSRCLLCDHLHLEQRARERIVFASAHFTVVVPFWAVWPFEILVLPNTHVANLVELNSEQRNDLASGLKRLTTIYDRVFEVEFPYSMGFHQSPTDSAPHPEWHLHAHFYPPLLRSATIRKFMVGFEMLGSPQRDITPEAAAEWLRTLSESV